MARRRQSPGNRVVETDAQRAGKAWGVNEVEDALVWSRQGASVRWIAQELDRTPGAVVKKLREVRRARYREQWQG